MAIAYISMGSNLGDRVSWLKKALKAISDRAGSTIKYSLVYETQSWGYQGSNFLNMVIMVDTSLVPEELLKELIQIELHLGRIKGAQTYTDRTIDLDILFYENVIMNSPDLVLPHPFVHERLFVLIPLNDISPEQEHPVLKKPIYQLTKECNDTGWIKYFGDIKPEEV